MPSTRVDACNSIYDQVSEPVDPAEFNRQRAAVEPDDDSRAVRTLEAAVDACTAQA
jgi:hypothetical protein